MKEQGKVPKLVPSMWADKLVGLCCVLLNGCDFKRSAVN